MKFEDNTFTRKELAELLGVDVIPGALASAWNSFVGNLPLGHGTEKGEHILLIQEGQKEKTFRGGSIYENMPGKLINNAGYYAIDSGFDFGKSVSLDVGINALKNKRRDVSEGKKNIVPGFNDPARNEIHQFEALSVFVDYDDQKAMPVVIATESGLCVKRPQNREELIETLKAVGGVMRQIREGHKPDFVALRNHLIENVGLKGFEPTPEESTYLRKKTERTMQVLGL